MSSNEQQALGAVEELAAMIDAATQEEGCTIFDHSPEEIGLHVMENHTAIRAALTPTDQVEADGDKALAIVERHAAKWRKEAAKHYRQNGGRSDHEQADLERAKICDAIAADIRAATPDKALMRDAAVGEALQRIDFTLAELGRSAWIAKADSTQRLSPHYLASATKDMRGDIASIKAALTTPTPVEELEKGAAGEVLASLVAVLPAPTSAHTLAYSDAYNRAKAALAATNAGQVEALRWLADERTTQEALDGPPPPWVGMSAQDKLDYISSRTERRDEAILNARAALTNRVQS